MKLKVYLAGPTVFHPDFAAIFRDRRRLCAEFGFEGVPPIDGDAEITATTDDPAGLKLLAAAIRQANIDKIRASHAIIADITPFRGPGADDGTAWEMGFGEALGKVVLAFSEDADAPYATQVEKQLGMRPATLGNPQPVDVDGLLVENFALPANLMLAAGPERVLPSFEAALVRLGEILKSA
jgi:nucleoside 2-deoxyribosyltransferase